MAKHSADEEYMGPLECGRSRYYHKDYAGALEVFTKAVEISTGHLLHTALDHRAAAYEKLGQLQPALKDAKRMIDMMPGLAKGYLRCGKVLQLKEQDDLALKIYERGLRKVKMGTDSDRTKLQTMYNQLWLTQNKGKCLDPLVYLPNELARMVCEHLEMRDRVTCLAVSKPWKRFLESSHKLWTTLDTTYTRTTMRQKSLSAHLKRSNYTVDRAVITCKAMFDVQKWRYLFKTCKRLEDVTIYGKGFIGDSLFDSLDLAKSLQKLTIGTNCLINQLTIVNILKTCRKTLVAASFLAVQRGTALMHQLPYSCEALKYFCLHAVQDCSIDIVGMCTALPNLTSLLLDGFAVTSAHAVPISDFAFLAALKHLTHLQLREARLPSVIYNLPPTLKHLNICKGFDVGTVSSTDSGLSVLPLLETFNCAETAMSNAAIAVVTAASIKAGNLRTLGLDNRVFRPPNVNTINEYPASESVEELSIAGLIITDQEALKLLALYPKLTKLDLSSTKITGVVVKAFVEAGIKWLGLKECHNVSPDAVGWARARGVEVLYLFQDAAAGRSWQQAFG